MKACLITDIGNRIFGCPQYELPMSIAAGISKKEVSMRALIMAIVFVVLGTLMAGCYTCQFFNYDGNRYRNSSFSDPQFQYGGTFTVRAQATHGVNQ